MKIKLKKDKTIDQIPRVSGEYKRLISLLLKNKEVEIDSLPKGFDSFIDEVPMKANNKKGDK
tara:strand:+ start:430 stop:615 length:186 start_codon:yes stop_codon:yes gene_type:complete